MLTHGVLLVLLVFTLMTTVHGINCYHCHFGYDHKFENVACRDGSWVDDKAPLAQGCQSCLTTVHFLDGDIDTVSRTCAMKEARHPQDRCLYPSKRICSCSTDLCNGPDAAGNTTVTDGPPDYGTTESSASDGNSVGPNTTFLQTSAGPRVVTTEGASPDHSLSVASRHSTEMWFTAFVAAVMVMMQAVTYRVYIKHKFFQWLLHYAEKVTRWLWQFLL